MSKEIVHFKVTIKDNETKAERDRSYIDYKGELKYTTSICFANKSEDDIYDKSIGIVVSILKTLGFSKRIIGSIARILLDEAKKKQTDMI